MAKLAVFVFLVSCASARPSTPALTDPRRGSSSSTTPSIQTSPAPSAACQSGAADSSFGHEMETVENELERIADQR